MTRAENVAEAQRLRGEGLSVSQIAVQMGVGRSTASTWLADPDLSKQRARHARYGGQCVDCGKPTTGNRGREKAPERCSPCSNAHNARWTRESVMAAIHLFADRYGRPPTATDFNPAHAIARGHGWRAKRWQRDADYPSIFSVQRVFGSWSAGVAAAGFEPTKVGCYARARHDTGHATGAHLESERQAA